VLVPLVALDRCSVPAARVGSVDRRADRLLKILGAGSAAMDRNERGDGRFDRLTEPSSTTDLGEIGLDAEPWRVALFRGQLRALRIGGRDDQRDLVLEPAPHAVAPRQRVRHAVLEDRRAGVMRLDRLVEGGVDHPPALVVVRSPALQIGIAERDRAPEPQPRRQILVVEGAVVARQ